MKPRSWFLVMALLGAALGGWLAASCAIDDDITWAGGGPCTGTCTSPPPASYECDIDSRCTPSPGCTDWDCTERADDWVGPDVADTSADVGGPHLDAGEDLGDITAGGDVPDEGEDCVPVGVGYDRASAEFVTVGVVEPGLTACLTVSGWLRFDAAEGTRYELELSAVDGAALAFQIYSGADPAVLAAAVITGTGSHGLEAAESTAFYVRLRAVTLEPTAYTFSVREL